MPCGSCRYFAGQKTASGRVKRAAGRCGFPVELPLLPSSVDILQMQSALKHRYAVWPDEGEDCPTYERAV